MLFFLKTTIKHVFSCLFNINFICHLWVNPGLLRYDKLFALYSEQNKPFMYLFTRMFLVPYD